MRLNKSTRLPGAIGTWAIGVVMVCIAAAAMVLAARQPSQPANITAVETQRHAAPATVESTAKKPAIARAQVKKATAPKTPAASTLPANAPAPYAPAAKAPAVEPVSKAVAQEPDAPVTITGCLEERKDQTFRLKNTTGGDAPKSRSWKSGFLKKGSTSIDLVDASNRAKLQSHVGQQISVTGMLVDREMQVRSLQRVAESCD
jgi:hypothetical protein